MDAIQQLLEAINQVQRIDRNVKTIQTLLADLQEEIEGLKAILAVRSEQI